jgi:hypothetical protein
MSARLMIQAARVCPTISGLPLVALGSLAAQRGISCQLKRSAISTMAPAPEPIRVAPATTSGVKGEFCTAAGATAFGPTRQADRLIRAQAFSFALQEWRLAGEETKNRPCRARGRAAIGKRSFDATAAMRIAFKACGGGPSCVNGASTRPASLTRSQFRRMFVPRRRRGVRSHSGRRAGHETPPWTKQHKSSS